MKKNICHSLILLLLVSIGSLTAQNGSLATRQSIARFLNSHVSGELAIGKITVDSLTILDKAKKGPGGCLCKLFIYPLYTTTC